MDKKPEEVFRCCCCFCGDVIEENKVEPLAVSVFERAADNGQQLFAHVDCLGSRLHWSIPFLSYEDRMSNEE